MKHLIAYVTVPDIETARTIAGDALEKRLIACANIISGVESHFRWEDRVETESEALMILKTTDAQVERLKQLVINRHPYDLPEFIVTPITDGHPAYLDWITQETGGD